LPSRGAGFLNQTRRAGRLHRGRNSSTLRSLLRRRPLLHSLVEGLLIGQIDACSHSSGSDADKSGDHV
jgi:hypothetical protein